MTAQFTREEFNVYLKGLEFKDIGDMAAFARPYLAELQKSILELDKTNNFTENYIRYANIMTEFGPAFINFIEQIENHRNVDFVKKAIEI